MFARLSPVALIVAILAVWRLTHLFWGEDGPGALLYQPTGAEPEGRADIAVFEPVSVLGDTGSTALAEWLDPTPMPPLCEGVQD